VGIVVDQMREEYLYRFYDQFGENGFKRLIHEGFNCRNTHYNYIPTVTGAGHASIYTGTTPRYHGIVGNDWYDRPSKKKIYCVYDSTEQLIGLDRPEKGASPKNLLATNLGDELKISTNLKAKVISISFKDRAAILPAGHMANAAYWIDHQTGVFISSTFYMEKLPDWVTEFNRQKKADYYLSQTWSLLKPETDYPLSIADDNNYEGKFKGKDKPVFPYNLKELSASNNPLFEMLYNSPLADDLLTDFAIEALKQENLGKGTYPDLLAISYSSTDAIGHKFGPLSKEINDTYLRLDLDIARLLETLDQQVGNGNYTVFLTADHAVSENTKYLRDHKVPTGTLDLDSLRKNASLFLNRRLGAGKWIEAALNNQFYLNRSLIATKGFKLDEVQNRLADYLRSKAGIAEVYTASQLEHQDFSQFLSLRIKNGFSYKRSGDVIIVTEPAWTDGYEAATHGTGYTYDTHVPLLLFGAGIRKGESFEHYNITDLAPTISMILKIKLPNACIGDPIIKALSE
jgi:predicted AlkP superfamily pyrophosphatase or phosphodiesterase